MKKVSIIIPIYNQEHLLSKCVDSIINQTYKDLEVLLINDGSTDDSLKIMREYAKKHNFISCYTHKNHGVSYTRNRGLSLATGDYITFVDPDDYLEEDYIEQLLNNAKDNDIVVCGYKVFDEKGFFIDKKPISNKIDLFSFLATHTKLYLTTFLRKNNIKFLDERISQDLIFTITCYSKTKKIKTIDYSGYLLYKNPKSVVHTISKKKPIDLLRLVKYIEDNIDLSNFEDLKLFLYIKTLVLNLKLQPKDLEYSEYNKIYINSFDYLKEGHKKYNKKFKVKFYKNARFKVNFANNLFIICYKFHLTRVLIFILKTCKGLI